MYSALGRLDNLLSEEIYPAISGVEEQLSNKWPASEGEEPEPKMLKSNNCFVHKKLSVDIPKLSRKSLQALGLKDCTSK